MHVHDEIAHVRVVDGLLRLRLPGSVSGGVIGIDANDVQLVEISELDAVHIGELAAENEMQQLPACRLIRHSPVPRAFVDRIVASCGQRRGWTLPEEPRDSRAKTLQHGKLGAPLDRRYDRHANSASRSRMRLSRTAWRGRPAATSAPWTGSDRL